MKVWLLHIGCVHEGGGTAAIYKTKESALKNAYEWAKKDSDCMIGFMEMEKSYRPWVSETDYILKEIPGGYQVGHDVWIVSEMEVQE